MIFFFTCLQLVCFLLDYTVYYDKQTIRPMLFSSSSTTPAHNLQYSHLPFSYSVPSGIYHVKWFHLKKGRKNNLISQTVHLARQLAMFIFTFNQFTASVCSLQFPSPWTDHMWAVEVGGWKFSCKPNVLTATAFSAWLIPFLLPTSTHQAFASLLSSQLPFAIHIVFSMHGRHEFKRNRLHITQKGLMSAQLLSF